MNRHGTAPKWLDSRPMRYCSYCGRQSVVVAIGSKCLMPMEPGDSFKRCPGTYRDKPTTRTQHGS